MTRIDINKGRRARAAKRETSGEPIVLIIGDAEFELPGELPFEFVARATDNDLRGALVELLNGSSDAFFEQKPTFNDVMELVQEVAAAYGFDNLGESAGSAHS